MPKYTRILLPVPYDTMTNFLTAVGSKLAMDSLQATIHVVFLIVQMLNYSYDY